MRSIKSVLIFIALAVLAACAKMPEVSPEKAAQLFQSKEAVIIDVREQDEWDEQHIDGAILIPLSEVESRLDEIAKYQDSTIIMQCRSGRRSGESTQMLLNAGFENVYNLKGGILAWDEANLATVKGAAKH